MRYRNNGNQKDEILQNQFTAYLKKALLNRKIRYLGQKQKLEFVEVELEYDFPSNSLDRIQAVAEREVLMQALLQLKEKERYIVLTRALEEKAFAQIANELGMTYRAVTSLYYRALQKLRAILEGGERDVF